MRYPIAPPELFFVKITLNFINNNNKRFGAAVARWAHNPKVRGSKPRIASYYFFFSLKTKIYGPAGIWTRIGGFRVLSANHYTTSPSFINWLKMKDKDASTGNRTRTSCLEGTNSNHWTIDACLFNFCSTHCGDRTHDHVIKSHALYHLS